MTHGRPPYVPAFLTAAGIFGLYAVTLAPTTGFWDASEYIATAHILGIPHPPGNPLFVALAKVWSILLAPSGLSVAVRVNLFAAFTSALASFFFFLVAHRVISGFVIRPWMAVAGAAASVLIGATTFTVWNQSTLNEKVYTVSLAVIAAVSWLAVLWRDRRDEPGSERWLLLAGYFLVLGSTNHLMSVLPLPALGLFVLAAGGGARSGSAAGEAGSGEAGAGALGKGAGGGGRHVLLRPRLWGWGVPLVLLGLSFNFFLPIRSAQDPVINEGEPTCGSVTGAAVAVFTQGMGGCPALAADLARDQYQKPPVTERMAPPGAQLLNWFQYFDWQWARGAEASELPGNARLPYTLLFLGLGLVGLWATLRGDREAFVYLGTLALVVTLGLVFYLNFKYGYSLNPEVTERALHEVRERDYFFIVGFMLWGILAGVGLTWIWSVVARQLASPRAPLFTLPILLVAAIPLLMNGAWASRADDWAARDWAYDLLMSVEPYGILFTNGDNDTFPLWYLQEVEGIRQDVTVVVGQYLFTSWYPRQLQRHTEPGAQRPFGGAEAEALYGTGHAPPPRPITELPPEQMDATRGRRLEEDLVLSFPTLAVTFPAGMGLDRSQLLALGIIRDSLGERPVYFAGVPGIMNQLRLGDWAVRQGLVAKLVLRPLDDEQPEGFIEGTPGFGGEWYDYPRTLELYQDVYQYRGLRERAVWADRATLNIPWHYYALALQLADVGSRGGMDPRLFETLQADAEDFLTTSQGGILGTPRRLLPAGG